jgi:hypothetical protein
MQINVRLLLVGAEGGAQLAESGKTEALGGLDHHGFGQLRIRRHLLQRQRVICRTAQHHLSHAHFARRQFGQKHSNAGPDGPWIECQIIIPCPAQGGQPALPE